MTASNTITLGRKKRQRPEHELHKAVAAYLASALRPPVFWTTFPAGGGGKARGGQLKAVGLKAGVPDILIFMARPISPSACTVIGIELKTAKGALSDEQVTTHYRMGEAAVRCRVARSVEHVQDILIANGVPIHARVMGGYHARSA